MKKKDLSILFIGNSHTYYNDMPLMVKRRAEEEGYWTFKESRHDTQYAAPIGSV